YQILAEASYHQYQPSIFFDNADINFEQIKDNKTKALILMACEKWEEAYSYWDIAINKQEIDYYYQLMCYQHIYHQGHKLAINISDLEKLTENKSVLYLFKALIYNSQQNLEDAIKQLNLCLTYNTSSLFLKRYQPQLLLADIYRRIGELAKCHSQLIDFEKHTRNNTQCRIQIAKLALKTKNYSKVIKQLDQAFNNNFRMMPLSVLDIYFKASKETLANEQLDKLH
ncbi:tetratricopeptide repeat protein, partial [Gilliamella sp. Occ3-1]|uniref:tetratricopeptide repeat protein n=1 Tax=Gilliamella sp. Occ3-1 TaxID=3120253 RepID=UPI001C400BEE